MPTRSGLGGGWRLTAFVCAALALPGVARAADDARNAPPSPEVQAVLARFDHAQKDVRTLRAAVTETRRLAVLDRPEVLRGELSFERPGRVRWEYSAPEKRVYVLADGKLTGWIPGKNQVERMNVSRYEQRVRRMIALGQDSKSLLKDFRVTLGTGAPAGRDELLLEPKSRRMRKRVALVTLQIDRADGLPHQVQYRTGDGNTVALDLADVRVNQDLAPDTFALRIPPGAHVVEGLSSLGFGPAADDSGGEEF